MSPQVGLRFTDAGPVTFGVGFATGRAWPGDAWRVSSDDGRCLRTQVRSLDLWPDGSVRWLLVHVHVPDEGAAARWRLECITEPVAGGPVVRATEAAGAVHIDTGAIRLVFQADAPRLITSVDGADGALLDADGGGVCVTDESGAQTWATPSRVEIEDAGPLMCTVLLTGRIPLAGRVSLDFLARVRAFAGMSAVRVSVTIRNPNRARHPGGFWDLGDPGSVLMRDASFQLAGSAPASAVRASVEMLEPWTACGQPFELYQDSSGGEY